MLNVTFEGKAMLIRPLTEFMSVASGGIEEIHANTQRMRGFACRSTEA
jgi:hypothetical protein